MGAGLYSGEPIGDPAGVPSDPECWSEDSKRSVAYYFLPRPYRDKAYLCWRCRVPEVFTAADQKYAFEVRKVNISQQRVLCGMCHREWVRLQREASEQQKSFIEHAQHLIVHGVLHAQGYDHEDEEEADEMEQLEADILSTLDIANPYL